ncbi:MAG: DUF1549 and DUF1553 domain-containing protein [Pirellulales bacterium]
MIRTHALATAFVAFLLAASLGHAAEPDAESKKSRLPDPGELTSLAVETGHGTEARLEIRGADTRQQLLVTGVYASGQGRDLTAETVYESQPEGVISIDASGMLTPLDDGSAILRVRHEAGPSAELAVTVRDFDRQPEVHFANHITPIFTKHGCNGGGCHGKSGGQNGFRLSLLGFEPPEDYQFLVKEARGRRVFPAAPDRSLLLLKATGQLPHGGGERFTEDSYEYRLMRRWIAQGLPYGAEDAPTVDRIEVFPRERIMDAHAQQQLLVIAHYTDGSTQDVTRMAQFEPNAVEMAEVSPTGVVTTIDQTGDVAVMVRYQAQVDVFRATIPLGIQIESMPQANNFIDELAFAKLKQLGLPPSELCDDATFLRRSTVAIAGRLPTLEESQEFMADASENKRDRLIDRLLGSIDYAENFANKWATVLRNKRVQDTYKHGTYAFHMWIRNSLHQNMPYDQFVREIVAASGDIGRNPPVAWYREVNEVEEQVEDTAQLFLGMRIQCARCHHHPFEKWSQKDYYSLAAFFSQVQRKEGELPSEQRIFHNPGKATAKNPKTGENELPTGLGDEPQEVAPDYDPRQALADWMSQPDNPFFARALVNRYWKHFFSRGLVEPEDDMRVTNPATNPELLDAVAEHFVESGYDLKDLVRTICRSRLFQLSSEPNPYNADDKQNYSRYFPRRLRAEVLLDSVDSLTGSPTKYAGMPAGTRAVALPDTEFNSFFLTVFGRPEAATACECERTSDANLAQSLHLINSNEIQQKLASKEGRAAILAADAQRTPADNIAELYMRAYSRLPTPDEQSRAMAYIEKAENVGHAYEDIVWALINTKEFLFDH